MVAHKRARGMIGAAALVWNVRILRTAIIDVEVVAETRRVAPIEARGPGPARRIGEFEARQVEHLPARRLEIEELAVGIADRAIDVQPFGDVEIALDLETPDARAARILRLIIIDIVGKLDRSEEHTSELQSLMRIS